MHGVMVSSERRSVDTSAARSPAVSGERVPLRERFGDEVLMHHEFSRSGGDMVAFALPLVQYFDEAQLRALIDSAALAMGDAGGLR